MKLSCRCRAVSRSRARTRPASAARDSPPDEDPEPLYGTAGAFNYGGYRSSALEALIDEARGAVGPVARAPILDRIARLLSDEQPVIFLYRYDIPALASTRVHGLAAVADRFDLRRVWLDP